MRGINNGMKRRKMFRFLKRQNADIYLLQETHCNKRLEFMFESEWGNKCLFSNGTSNNCGVAMLLTKSVANGVRDIVRDIEGRCIQIKLTVQDKVYCITNLYAPNSDSPHFFEDVFNKVNEMDCVYNVIGGDFNVVREKEDRNSNTVYHKRCKNSIDAFMEANNYTDIWRVMNPGKKFFTHMTHGEKLSWSRIDYFLVSQSVGLTCDQADIVPSINTDHSLVSINLFNEDGKRGPGIWKFNNTLLKNESFVNEMRQHILSCNDAFSYLNAQEYWDLLKFEMKQFSIKKSVENAFNDKQEKFEAYRKLSALQREFVIDKVPDPDVAKEIQLVKNEIDSYETLDAKKAAFRCKVQWSHQGEKSSKYFFNMEKRNFLSKTMYMVYKNDGVLTKDYREILNVQYEFYCDLYKEDPNVKFTLKNESGLRLNDNQRNLLENVISKDELFDALMTLRSNKVPGGDGLTLEFYRTFWKNLKEPLYKSFMEALEVGKFGASTKRGIINLIPKKLKNELYVRNWRPIVLLNVDWKIWSKAIANRLETTTELIGQQQQGFIKNRSLFNNIMTTWEVVSYLRKRNMPGIVCLIDFEKCFDRISFESIMGTFKYFGFGGHFIRMLSLLFSDVELCTISNGYTSKFLKKGRGTNQGDPSSPLIYSYCGEIMAHLILSNKDIRGIDLDGIKQVLSQFADDTAAFLTYELLTVEAFSKVLTHVEEQMGLKVSYDKTTMYRVGSLFGSEAMLYTQQNFRWSSGPMSLLGVKINCDGSMCQANFDEVFKKVRNTCNVWINRKATLFGKILILNTLIGSMFVYKLSTMMYLTDKQVEKIENLFREFIWNGKKSKISLMSLQKKREQAGLRLVDIKAKQDTLRVAWVYRINDNDFLRRRAYAALDPNINEIIWKCSLAPSDVKKCFSLDSLWTQMLFAWSKINYRTPETKAGVLNQVLWYNSMLKCKKEIMNWPHWISKGIFLVEDLLREDHTRKTAEELNVNWLEFNTMWKCFPETWLALLDQANMDTHTYLYSNLFALSNSNRNRKVYNLFIDNDTSLLKYYNRWRDRGLIFGLNQYEQAFVNLYQCTKITKYRDFQYRLTLGKIILNVDLHDWGISDTPNCKLCQQEVETMSHAFFTCCKVQLLKKYLYDLCDMAGLTADKSIEAWILGRVVEQGVHIINFVNIMIKQFIYKNRCLNLSVNIGKFENELELLHNTELYIAKRENRLKAHIRRWSPIVKFT